MRRDPEGGHCESQATGVVVWIPPAHTDEDIPSAHEAVDELEVLMRRPCGSTATWGHQPALYWPHGSKMRRQDPAQD